MSSLRCPRCGTTAPEHFVSCPSCHALFHAARLTALDGEAAECEQRGDVVGALARLRAMEPLLPSASTQATELRKRIASLEPKAGSASTTPRWLAGLGAAGVVAWKFAGPLLLLLSKAKFLLFGLAKLPTLLSFLLSVSLWRDGSGGVGLALVVLGSIYVHEMGHTWAFRRYGIEVSAPMFVPGFGAFVRGSHYPTSLAAIGDVALSGPVWGGVSGVVTLLIGVLLREPWLIGAALIIAEINLFNLIPVWQLDGSRATSCVSRTQLWWVGGLALGGGLLVGAPMAMLAGVGLLARRWVRPPTGDGDRRTFTLFLSLIASLLVLRVVAHWASSLGAT